MIWLLPTFPILSSALFTLFPRVPPPWPSVPWHQPCSCTQAFARMFWNVLENAYKDFDKSNSFSLFKFQLKFYLFKEAFPVNSVLPFSTAWTLSHHLVFYVIILISKLIFVNLFVFPIIMSTLCGQGFRVISPAALTIYGTWLVTNQYLLNEWIHFFKWPHCFGHIWVA